ncbi:MAG: hypothetical protein KAR42_17860 [candidate division Zixibacteria bacterium]|nr:hypothetical protein [candidate division Zixibacteria bacterium]
MNPDLAKNPHDNQTYQYKRAIRSSLKFFTQRISPGTKNILDIGQRSPLTDAMEDQFRVKITNTIGDLDEFLFPENIGKFDVILYIHTIEHQFNPLGTLLELEFYMNRDSVLYIALPRRGKLLWDRGHFHEIDHYRMQLLIERAGMQIVEYQRIKHHRKWYSYFKGLRMFARLFFEYDAYYTIKLRTNEKRV